MYQAREVDYLVATDAIGMGLNMDVDHVAFAQTRKFDGRAPRDLSPAELAQIAGRAGRHMSDGTFGSTAEAGGLDADVVGRIENHDFDPVKTLFWRNADLRFTSLRALQASLAAPPPAPGLVRARAADDELVLAALARDAEIAALATAPDSVRLLWDLCRIPDFGKVLSDAHARLVGRIFRHLMADGRLPTDWVARQVARIDRTDGDIEAIVQRIAGVRTWTYVAFHGAWLADAGHWQELTQGVEDRLSDALHQRLTQRFVDRRTALLVRRLEDRRGLAAVVAGDGAVLVEGHAVGRLEGFRFVADWSPPEDAARRAVANAAARALKHELAARLEAMESAADERFELGEDDHVLWNGEAVARLAPGPRALQPGLEPLTGEAPAAARERVRRRLAAWLEGMVAARLAPLVRAQRAPLRGAARGLVFQLCEGLGSIPRHRARAETAALDRSGRQALRRLGVRLGRESVFMPALLKPAAVQMRTLLWAVHAGRRVAPPAPGRMSVPVGDGVPRAFYEAVGYRPLGPLALRLDVVERLAARAWSLSRAGPFAAGPELLSLAGCGGEDMAAVLAGLGYRARRRGGAVSFDRAPRRRRKARAATDSPFAKLGDMAAAR